VRAVVLAEFPGPLRVVDDWPEPQPGSGQVVVQVRGVGVCGSDLALLGGHRPPPALPWVPGHESTGEIVAIGPAAVAAGPGAGPGRIGQRVIIEPNFPCLSCPTCRSGRTSACPHRVSLGFNAPGVLAERIAVPAQFAWPVPAGWHDADAVCAEPFTVAQAAIRRSGVRPGSRCLVVGAGSQGSLLCLALLDQGIVPQVLEPHPGRRSLAASLGAELAAETAGGFDAVFETSGVPAALTEAVSRAGRGGVLLLIGQSSEPASLVTRTVVQRQLTLRGSLIYEHPDDFAAALARSGRVTPSRVLSACYPLADAAAAFQAARQAPGKTWIQVTE
jgi:2-desacetyl-2-hydroxyethyl bacteriochlorophyllide A dehydrogenase